MKIFEKYNLRNFDFKGFLTRFLCVFIGAFIVSIVYNAFVKEYTLVTGGVSGLAIIINKYFGISTVDESGNKFIVKNIMLIKINGIKHFDLIFFNTKTII